MLPQRRRRESLVDLATLQSRNRFLFSLARNQQHDLPRLENRPDAHGDGVRRHVSLREEISIRDTCRLGQRDYARAGVEGRARLVEADVAVAAEAEESEVET